MTVALAVLLPPGVAGAVPDQAHYQPGAPGVGDDHFPLAGNGGYDVAHYDLDLTVDPTAGRLDGVATIRARVTDDLRSLNLDLVGCRWRRSSGPRCPRPRRPDRGVRPPAGGDDPARPARDRR